MNLSWKDSAQAEWGCQGEGWITWPTRFLSISKGVWFYDDTDMPISVCSVMKIYNMHLFSACFVKGVEFVIPLFNFKWDLH